MNMYHRIRRKMHWWNIFSAIFIVQCLPTLTFSKTIDTTIANTRLETKDDFYDNNIIDFDDDYELSYNKKYGINPTWSKNNNFNKQSHKYTIVNDLDSKLDVVTTTAQTKAVLDEKKNKTAIEKTIEVSTDINIEETTTEFDYSVMPLELLSTTENILVSLVESTVEPDLTVIPLSTTASNIPNIHITETITLPTSTVIDDINTSTGEDVFNTTTEINIPTRGLSENIATTGLTTTLADHISPIEKYNKNNTNKVAENNTSETLDTQNNITEIVLDITKMSTERHNITKKTLDKEENLKINSSKEAINSTDRIDIDTTTGLDEKTKPIFTELDVTDSSEVPEDYYDLKDIVPTRAPSTDALSVIFGLAGSVVESMVGSVAERVVPKGIFDLFKRMQRQSEALEAEKLRSREENGGLGKKYT